MCEVSPNKPITRGWKPQVVFIVFRDMPKLHYASLRSYLQ